MKLNVAKLQEKSVIGRAGVRFFVTSYPRPAAVPVVAFDRYDGHYNQIKLDTREWRIPRFKDEESPEATVAAALDGFFLFYLARDPNVHRLEADGTPGDFYRMIAAVEESNACFEAFVLPAQLHPEKTLCGYPAYVSDAMPGRTFGGMWSDAVVLLCDRCEADANTITVHANWIARHGVAFAMLQQPKPKHDFNLEAFVELVRDKGAITSIPKPPTGKIVYPTAAPAKPKQNPFYKEDDF